MTEENPIEVPIEQLPFFKLKSLCKERGIKIKTTDKKDALIAMLRTGESIHKEKPKVKAPILEPKKVTKVVPMLPEEIKGQLEGMAQQGLKWTIDEDNNTVKFSWAFDVTINLDSSAMNILSAARESKGARRPTELGRDSVRGPVEWGR